MTDNAVPLDGGICPPEAPYPASYAARIANNDPTQCVPVDPCGPGGSTLWHVVPCDTTTTVPETTVPSTTVPTTDTTVVTTSTVAVVTVGAEAPQLAVTGGFEFGVALAGVIAIALGLGLRSMSKRHMDGGDR
jgi:hypothetical protein